ncbi:YraN family protein [Sulfuricurvum sp. IAE1]|uniref:YraN family protein n=1 Tax=Sulfuricurvum sp. IAE1 TaxID=2546102 RepID=UPI0010437821|nr:YraN family protein [Sulfuricurvum sp. IAE1]MDD3769624.1 YraN family protein [Sulfuricurvum sp.]MDX9965488.1 YraN family protein [Sulfuricurvum sp.]TDA62705.1 YraN family protein [Sulfuricurvum sp. IAE1]
MHTRAIGNAAEERGCDYLRSRGLRIIDRNVYNRFGEIDIIAIQGNVLRFVEVKSARSYEQAVHNITPAKLSKLNRAIQSYLQQKRLNLDYCVDALIVWEEGIEWIENITLG